VGREGCPLPRSLGRSFLPRIFFSFFWLKILYFNAFWKFWPRQWGMGFLTPKALGTPLPRPRTDGVDVHVNSVGPAEWRNPK